MNWPIVVSPTVKTNSEVVLVNVVVGDGGGGGEGEGGGGGGEGGEDV